ncbi:CMRF35-like molecule 5 isoform X2 [Neoarius graeffei]|uniref:CMRF35-like molecule 5 isoform X2 n=1 Tax=Neoarius graeffei TaxID=443677 RepID=UPI00298BCF42|nr:CMRF35-like molecule 5 isoform X2 [Neoarius graeffei]XP_060755240.1 CMRF35-like molecule 5 isoform X2 [Neoarius graeffei]XP_060755241.1 CMRF35-like molecule 5 isoform X2 [Neoarius graeffei]XP_060755242.1 CMRF35-like molecule 5 isoform X2 [Neoarius graeffei]
MKILLIFTFCLMIADDTDAVTTITGYRGRSVQIQCPYQPGYEKYKKYLCGGKCPILGDKDIPVESGSPAKDPRFSLYDDTTAKIFTVTITDLRPEDEGTYWCAIERTVADIYTEIRLLVKTADPAISTVSQSTHSTSTHAMSPSVHAEIPHSTANPLNNSNSPVSAPSDQDLPVSTVIIAVSVVLVLLIALLFTVILQKKKKIQSSETVRQSPRETNRDYENDQNVLPLQARESAKPESVYQSLDPTTRQSDSVYQGLTFIRKQSDSVYQDLTFTHNQ